MSRHFRKMWPAAAARRGAITVLTAIMTIVMLALVAFAVDVGYILASKQ